MKILNFKTPATKAIKFIALPALLLLASSTAIAETGNGEALYKNNCTACHGTEVFTRADRRVKDLAGLNAQVRRCNHALEKKWFNDDINAVVSYLNKQFYKF